MAYQGSVITRLYTRTTGRVADGFLSDCVCLDEADPHPKGQDIGFPESLIKYAPFRYWPTLVITPFSGPILRQREASL